MLYLERLSAVRYRAVPMPSTDISTLFSEDLLRPDFGEIRIRTIRGKVQQGLMQYICTVTGRSYVAVSGKISTRLLVVN